MGLGVLEQQVWAFNPVGKYNLSARYEKKTSEEMIRAVDLTAILVPLIYRWMSRLPGDSWVAFIERKARTLFYSLIYAYVNIPSVARVQVYRKIKRSAERGANPYAPST